MRAPGPLLQAGGALTAPKSDRASRSRSQGRRCRCSVPQLRDRTRRICREVHITTRHEAAGEQEGFASAVASGDDLDDAFAWKEERRLSQALTRQYDKVIFISGRASQPRQRSASTSPFSTTPMAGLRSATTAPNSHTAPSTRFARSTRKPSLTTSTWGSVGGNPGRTASPRIPAFQRAAPTRSARRPSLQGRLSLSTSGAGLTGYLGRGWALRYAGSPRHQWT
jgi:hypothetical protein